MSYKDVKALVLSCLKEGDCASLRWRYEDFQGRRFAEGNL